VGDAAYINLEIEALHRRQHAVSRTRGDRPEASA
jgi:hypothetical protein